MRTNGNLRIVMGLLPHSTSFDHCLISAAGLQQVYLGLATWCISDGREGAYIGSSAAQRSVNENLLPLSTPALWHHIRPPMPSTSPLQIANPRPTPGLSGLP